MRSDSENDPDPSGDEPSVDAELESANPYESFAEDPQALHRSLGQRPAGESTEAADGVPIEPELIAEFIPEEPAEKRIWTSILVVCASLAAFLLVSGVMAAVSIYVVHGELSVRLLRDPLAMQKVTESRIGLVLLVVIPQLAMVAPPILAAMISPVRTGRRLGLVRGHWPIWAWVAAALATPLVGLISSVVVGSFMAESENLKTMSGVFRDHGANGFLIPLALMIGATPAICEELLFRGYVQTRLAKSWGPAAGIVIASVLFAGFHMDLVHVIAVLPLGLFLGFVSWRSGSLLPAMLGHFVNNVISVVAVVLAPEDQSDITLGMPVAIMSLSIMTLGFFGGLAVIAASIVYSEPNRDPPTAVPIPNQ